MLGHIDPFFQLALTQWPLFLNNSQHIFDNLSPNDPFFWHFVNIVKFLSTMCQHLYFTCKICLIPTVWPPFLVRSFHWWPPYLEKNLTEGPLVSGCFPSIPVTSQVKCPPPPPAALGEGKLCSHWWNISFTLLDSVRWKGRGGLLGNQWQLCPNVSSSAAKDFIFRRGGGPGWPWQTSVIQCHW